ncbi:GNAT family N-acetyltransferase [Asticcacaulis machinosus]|uniref:GNAT family N-acetyltransferase n=1 Tax=Asticcacaulis machinosus TaxID=2984211 RepID=A0ABT5HF66_9CAUL|nr:GNAT family N-acetyltransferase [Asticcacaulis machinosus]MDC7674899.1 GNAT family N-acetyltransferase [Asticcacaulis machinosus]
MNLSHIEVITTDQLNVADLALWAQCLKQRPELWGPYFDVRYFQAIAKVVPHAFIARLYGGDRLLGFFPFQKRGRIIQAFAAPLTDFQAVISVENIDLSDLVCLLKARRFEFQGLIDGSTPCENPRPQKRLYADLSAGFETYFRTNYEQHKKVFRNSERCRRNLNKDYPDLIFSWEPVTSEILKWIVDCKRSQYRQSGLHDVFACGWTVDMLQALAKQKDNDFGLMAGVYRHGERIIAVEVALKSGSGLHLWFPGYDPAFARYGVGILMTLDIMKAVEGHVKRVDFGCGDEAYKSPLTTHSEPCWEGHVTAAPSRNQSVSRMNGLRAQLMRRLRIVRACELKLSGQLHGGWQIVRRAIKRSRLSVSMAVSIVLPELLFRGTYAGF